MNEWLNNFAYRIDLGVGLFLVGAVAAILIGLFTVSMQTIKAAMRNPASTLRYE